MATKTTTQDFVPITEVKDGIAILENGQMCGLLLVSSINFALKSNDEQQAILAQFQAFLNTIDFSIQIYVQSRELDIRPYMEVLRSRESEQYNDLMRIQLREYMEFITAFTNEVDIMKKSFFVVVPYTPNKIDLKGIKGLLNTTKKETTTFDPARFLEDKTQLEQRITVVEQGLSRIGVRTIPLGTDEVVELYYHIFNPEEKNSAPKQ